jgi:hypothetical protein
MTTPETAATKIKFSFVRFGRTGQADDPRL